MFTRILANRLKRIMPVIVAPTQCDFIPSHNSVNNTIVAQEILHKIRHSLGNKGFMTIKLILEKVYDKLSWQFVVDSLKEISLNSQFINIIWYCISTTTMNIV